MYVLLYYCNKGRRSQLMYFLFIWISMCVASNLIYVTPKLVMWNSSKDEIVSKDIDLLLFYVSICAGSLTLSIILISNLCFSNKAGQHLDNDDLSLFVWISGFLGFHIHKKNVNVPYLHATNIALQKWDK